MTVVYVVLDGVPVAKGRPRLSARNGIAQVHTDAKTAAYEKLLKAAGVEAMKGAGPLSGPLRLQVIATMPIPPSWPKRDREAALAGTLWPTGSPDLDNFVKITDAFNGSKAVAERRNDQGKVTRKARPAVPGILWSDDSQVVEILARKKYGAIPSLSIRVETIEPEARLI